MCLFFTPIRLTGILTFHWAGERRCSCGRANPRGACWSPAGTRSRCWPPPCARASWCASSPRRGQTEGTLETKSLSRNLEYGLPLSSLYLLRILRQRYISFTLLSKLETELNQTILRRVEWKIHAYWQMGARRLAISLKCKQKNATRNTRVDKISGAFPLTCQFLIALSYPTRHLIPHFRLWATRKIISSVFHAAAIEGSRSARKWPFNNTN